MGRPFKVVGTRGRFVESEHKVVYAVVKDGKVIDSGGDISLNRAMRSSAKLIQALVCLETGAAETYRFTDAELAVIASSHGGTELHTKAVSRMLRKCGLSERHLQCGPQRPLDDKAYEKLLLSGRKPQRIHHNCSGKHAGILSASKYMGWPLRTYRRRDHPWNKRVFELVSLFTGIRAPKISHAIDGCGVPVIFVPVRHAALAFARYSTPESLPESIAGACRRMSRAVNRHPVHCSGPNRFLAALYGAAPNRFVAKEGGQGVFCLGVLGENMGIAIKVLDGRPMAFNPYEQVAIELLKRHGLLNNEELASLDSFVHRKLYNSRGEVIGEVKIV